MFSAITKAKFDFQEEGAYHQQTCHNKWCKSLISKDTQDKPQCTNMWLLIKS